MSAREILVSFLVLIVVVPLIVVEIVVPIVSEN